MPGAGRRRKRRGGPASLGDPRYRDGALAWVAGKNMYNGTGRGFIYLPQAAILYVPFAMLPVPLGGLLWRAISLSVFAVWAYFGRPISFRRTCPGPISTWPRSR